MRQRVLCDRIPRTMSGGEPSSIKREYCATQQSLLLRDQANVSCLLFLEVKGFMYQVLYRKYRPRVFSDGVGQDHISGTLQS